MRSLWGVVKLHPCPVSSSALPMAWPIPDEELGTSSSDASYGVGVSGVLLEMQVSAMDPASRPRMSLGEMMEWSGRVTTCHGDHALHYAGGYTNVVSCSPGASSLIDRHFSAAGRKERRARILFTREMVTTRSTTAIAEDTHARLEVVLTTAQSMQQQTRSASVCQDESSAEIWLQRSSSVSRIAARALFQQYSAPRTSPVLGRTARRYQEEHVMLIEMALNAPGLLENASTLLRWGGH